MKNAALRLSGPAALRQNGEALSRFEATQTYARAAAAARRKDALCIDKIA